jgi:hypothetical protein
MLYKERSVRVHDNTSVHFFSISRTAIGSAIVMTKPVTGEADEAND